MRISTDEVSTHVGQHVRIGGWLHRLRTVGQISFLVLRDGYGTVQAVLSNEGAEVASKLYAESVIEVDGFVALEDQAPGGCELKDANVTVLSKALAPPPLDLYRPSLNAALPTILDHAAVSLRHPRQRATFRIMQAALAGFRSALSTRRFTEVNTPKIVESGTESGAELFEVSFFDRRAYLAQSPQLYKQILVGVFERVFEVGPAFRAEPHDTPRHTNEFVSLDMEMGFIDDHRTVMSVLRDVVSEMVRHVTIETRSEIDLIPVTLPTVPGHIPAIHFTEAQEIIEQETSEDVSREPDLAPSHEVALCSWSVREHSSDFLFVEGFPMSKRPFYTHPDPSRPEYSRGFDLLFRGWEIVTGGQRLHRYEDYVAALESRGQPVSEYEGYLEAFRHGMPPHGGFAIGLERFVARLVGAENVRSTTFFPRDIKRLAP